MIDCCCCCYEMLLLMIDAISNHNHRAWNEFVLFLKVFMKNGSSGNFVEMMFRFQVLYSFECLLWTKTYKQPLGTNLDVGDQNLGFWVKNSVKIVTTGEKSLETRYWRNLSGTFSLSARILLSAKLHSDNIPCFAFLRLFHTFLFWIGLWCKHESFR